ncbi:hypothetical protein EIKCOROL_01572 [Eikenella corrodens ATCC 23834]|uniref:Uncharacterized protein n=1 Tax=Eikenella corrodens ATCC 23834 TaxID=546274 RepID=C0DW26_EIKCO|nr:hypothetical protein EIKCOROL_01572 [Eikenella corrodens ATCC 23834]
MVLQSNSLSIYWPLRIFIPPKGVRLADGILASFPRDCLFGYGFLHLSVLAWYIRFEGYLKT